MSYKKLIPNIYLKDEKAYADKDLSVLLGNGDAVAAAIVSAKTVLMRFLSWFTYVTIHTKKATIFCCRLPNLLIHRYL